MQKLKGNRASEKQPLPCYLISKFLFREIPRLSFVTEQCGRSYEQTSVVRAVSLSVCFVRFLPRSTFRDVSHCVSYKCLQLSGPLSSIHTFPLAMLHSLLCINRFQLTCQRVCLPAKLYPGLPDCAYQLCSTLLSLHQ